MQQQVESKRIEQEKERLRSTILAEAIVNSEAIERNAEAHLYDKQKKAEGIYATMQAEANGLKELFNTTSDPKVALNYLMIDRSVFQQLASYNAEAIKGLQPKITYWNTNGNDSKNPMADVMKNIPPLVDTIYQQTGMAPAEWMMNMKDYVPKSVAKIT